MTTVEELQDTAARYLRAYTRSIDADRTRLLKDAANAFVDLRAHFSNEHGSTDWAGRSWDYRQRIGEVYSMAGISKSEVPQVAAAVRYHVGNALRDRLTSSELEEAGLRAEGPRARSVEKRERQSALLNTFRGSVEDLDPLRALTASQGLLKRVQDGVLRDLPAEEKKVAREILDSLAGEVERLHTDSRRRRR